MNAIAYFLLGLLIGTFAGAGIMALLAACGQQDDYDERVHHIRRS